MHRREFSFGIISMSMLSGFLPILPPVPSRRLWINDRYHPETRPNEILLGNMTTQHFYECCGWKSKRMGYIAYDIDNVPILGMADNNDDYFGPVFVERLELIAAGFEIV